MKNKRFLVNCLIGFVIFLLVITYFSRTVYAWTLPRVELGFSEKTSFQVYYEMHGEVVLTDEYEGYTAATEFFVPDEVLHANNTGNWDKLPFPLTIPLRGVVFVGAAVALRITPEGVYATLAYNPTRGAEREPIEVQGGESIIAALDFTTNEADFVVPSSAVHEDFEGKYILRVAERNTAMGRQFVLVREAVYLGASYQGKTSLSGVDISGAPIVFYADRELEPGMAVRFYP